MTCISCSMKAMLAGKRLEWFAETPEEHMARCHPDPVANKIDRQIMEKALILKMERKNK